MPNGIRLTEQQALELSAVWACIQVISSSIASCQVMVCEDMPNGRKETRPDDPISWLLNMRPNPDMTAVGFKEALLIQAVPFGNAYAEIVRDLAGRPSQLWPLPSDRVQQKRDPVTWEMFYEYLDPQTGTAIRLEQRDVFHMRGVASVDGLMGDNLIARAAKSFAVAAAQERYAGAFFANGANPGGVLEFAGKLTPERHTQLADDFKLQRSGPENSHRPLILEEGMKWNPTALEPQKTQLTEERQFSVEEIARWFNVPLHKIQHLLRATFSNIEHQSIEMVRDCLTPWERRFSQEGSYKLFPQKRAPWRYIKIDLEPLKEGDAKSRAEGNAIMRQNGVISTNEWRQKEGLNPKAGEEHDTLIVQSNMTALKNVMEPPAPKQAPARPQLGPGEDQADTDPEEAEGDAVAAQALEVVFCMMLGRYQRLIENRRRDLVSRHTAAEVAELLEVERERQVTALFFELAPAAPFAVRALGRGLMPEDVRRAIALVESGKPPAAAVAGVLPARLPA